MLRDTTPEVEAIQLEHIRRLTPSEKLHQLFGQIEFGMALHRAGTRFRMPDASGEAVRRQIVQDLYGEDAVRIVFRSSNS